MSSLRSGRLGVGLVGDAPFGAVFAAGLADAGHALIGAAVSDGEAADRVAAILPGLPRLPAAQVIERAELVILAETADRLEARIAELDPLWVGGQLVVHLCAEFGTAPLGRAVDAGVIPLAIHPALDVSGTRLDLRRLRWCAVTAPKPVVPIAQALVVELEAEPVVIAEADRPVYAAALRRATDFTHRVLAEAAAELESIGAPKRMLASVVRAAAESALDDPGDAPAQ